VRGATDRDGGLVVVVVGNVVVVEVDVVDVTPVVVVVESACAPTARNMLEAMASARAMVTRRRIKETYFAGGVRRRHVTLRARF
jgi:hypothetical protein